jgi:APA family basic amino acid/polyamine antiporter
MCYAELASTVPTAGSAYTYSYATIGEVFAWIIGWDLVLEFTLGAAVVSRGWSGYMLHLFPWLPSSLFGEGSSINVGAILIAAILGVVATVGVRESAWVTNLLVAIKVSVCLFVIALGAFYVKASNWTPFIPESRPVEAGTSGLEQPLSQWAFGITPTQFGIGGVLTATAVVFFAYSGFESVANMSEESKNPARDMPRGLLGSLFLCMALYVGVCIVITGMVPYDQIDEGAPIAAAFSQVGIGWAGVLISIAAVCGLTSVILVDMVGMGRIGFAMGRDGLLPRLDRPAAPPVGHPVADDHRHGRVRHAARRVRSAARPRGHGLDRDAVRVRGGQRGRAGTAPDSARPEPPVPGAAVPGGAGDLGPRVRLPDDQPVPGHLDPVRGVDGGGVRRVLRVGQAQRAPGLLTLRSGC